MQTTHQSKKLPSQENESFWMDHFNRFKATKLSKSKYARQHHLVLHRFAYWCKKLEKISQPIQPQVQGFVAVKLKPEQILPYPDILCTLTLGKGRQLLVHHESALRLLLESWK